MFYVGDFTEKELENGTAQHAIEKAKETTGLQYTDTKIIKIKGQTYLRIRLCTAQQFTI